MNLHSRHRLNCISLHIFILTVWCLSAAIASSTSVCGNDSAEKVRGCEAHDGHLSCARGLPPEEEGGQSTLVLELCDWEDETFDPTALMPKFALTKDLFIHAEHDPYTERHFSHPFPAGMVLESLNVSWLGLASLGPPGLLDSLAATLRSLDVSNNRLTTLAPSALLPLSTLDVAIFIDNPWQCSPELTWLLDTSLIPRPLVDVAKWTCGNKRFPHKPLLPVLNMIKTLRSQCPSRAPYNCSCELSNVVWGSARMGPDPPPSHASDEDEDGAYLIPVTMVNCSARGLYRLPPYLPANTTTLLLQRNMISDVRPLATNPYYRRVLDVFLDHNQVRSIASLEGAEWLSAFRVLSLRGNQLAQLPTYALDHAFQKNRNFAQLYLGSNPWTCDCMFTPGFQDLLAKYQSVVRDASDIKCARREGDDNSQMPIRELSRSVLCQEPGGSSLSGLDVLNGALALLIVLVLGKLAYDYWAFKTSGRLPWLVAKMP